MRRCTGVEGQVRVIIVFKEGGWPLGQGGKVSRGVRVT